jgi:hypothetical protein
VSGTCDVIDEIKMNKLVLKKQALHEVGDDDSPLKTPYGISQEYNETYKNKVIEVIQNTAIYMENIVYKDVKKTCKKSTYQL